MNESEDHWVDFLLEIGFHEIIESPNYNKYVWGLGTNGEWPLSYEHYPNDPICYNRFYILGVQTQTVPDEDGIFDLQRSFKELRSG